MASLRAFLLCATCLAAGVAACEPSFQAVYECDVHFEHCYALDESAAPVAQKKDCWRDWLHGYTYGESRDRVEYGGTRYSQLSLDPTLPNEDVSASQSKRTVAAPMPTNAFAPPPNVSEGRPGATSAMAVATRTPGADCADGCATRWTSCRAGCKETSCESCDQTYRACMPSCFGEESGMSTRSLR